MEIRYSILVKPKQVPESEFSRQFKPKPTLSACICQLEKGFFTVQPKPNVIKKSGLE